MKTSNMPGFAAEASLSNPAERYRSLGTPDPYANDGKMVPQTMHCYWESDAYGTYGWHCYGRPDM
jgi:hypothetical protein